MQMKPTESWTTRNRQHSHHFACRGARPGCNINSVFRLVLCFLLFGLPTWAELPTGGGFLGPNVQLASWAFADTNWLTAAGAAPLGWTNILVVPGGDGNALRVDSLTGIPAFLNYPLVNPDGTTNLMLDAGSVEFWYRPNQWAGTNAGGSGPGEWSRLLEVGAQSGTDGWWALLTDAGGGNLYFVGQSNGGTPTCFLSAPVSLTSNIWHYIALTYAGDESALYFDGNLLTNGLGVTELPDDSAAGMGFFVGSASDGSATMHGDMDDLATYNYALSSLRIAGNYGVYGLPVYGIASVPQAASGIPNAPSFNANGGLQSIISGPGNVLDLGATATCATNGPPAFAHWSSSVSGSNGNVFSFAVTGGTNGAPYDLLATTQLKGSFLTNANWVWVGQVYSCHHYALTNQPSTGCIYIMGTAQDSDGDGLTDAYELLVSKTNPNLADTNGNGLLDGWAVSLGLNPPTASPTAASQRANYTFNLESWLVTISGIKSEAFTPDWEGNLTLVQP